MVPPQEVEGGRSPVGVEFQRATTSHHAHEALADTIITDALRRRSRVKGAKREAVQLRVVGELGYAEIAARLDCTEGAARRRVHRGLARLNNLMQMEATP